MPIFGLTLGEALGLIVGLLAIFVAILAWMFPEYGRRVLLFLIRSPRFDWDQIPPQIAGAKKRVYIIQTWMPELRLNLESWRTALSNPTIECRVLLLDQKLVATRLRCRERVSSLLTQNVADFKELTRTFNPVEGKPRLEVKFYSCIPFGPVTVIDDDIYFGLFLSNRDSMQGPAFRCRATSRLGVQILDSLDAMWRTGSHSTGGLRVSPHGEHPDHECEEIDIQEKLKELKNMLAPKKFSEIQSSTFQGGYLSLVRHGETDLNVKGIITGDLDIGINAEGRLAVRQNGAWAARERWDRVYSSPLRRCIESVSESLHNNTNNVELRDELIEKAMGDLEGYARESYSESLPQYKGIDVFKAFHHAPRNGEAYCDVFWRIFPFLKDAISLVRQGKRVLIYSHEAPIRMMLMILLGLTEEDAVTRKIPCGEPMYFAAVE